jgi:hypothetical protein
MEECRVRTYNARVPPEISLYIKTIESLKKYQLVKQYKALILTGEDRCMPGKFADLNVDIWYLDGSGINNHLGAGIY